MTLPAQQAREMGYEVMRDSRGRLRVFAGDAQDTYDPRLATETCSVVVDSRGELVMTTEGR